MASISTSRDGLRSVWVTLTNGHRLPIRMGRAPLADVEVVKLRVEHLVASAKSGKPLSPATAEWLKDCEDWLRHRLTKMGLIAGYGGDIPRQLGPFIDRYLAMRTDIKPRTRTNFEQAKRLMVEYFKADRRIETITPADGPEWRRWLAREKKLEANSVRTHARRAKQFLQYAADKRILSVSPFADMADVSVKAVPGKFRFVMAAEAKRIIKACPDAQWRLLFALARYAGIRVPSEAHALQWCDVDWKNGRLLVRSPKTAHQGKESRMLPLFPELRPYLKAAFDEATAENPGRPLGYVITLQSIRSDQYGNAGTHMKRIIERAGITPWPELFRNLRRTRETELADHFPEHLVATWIGNSVKVAREHYLRPTDAHFQRAATVATAATDGKRSAKALRAVALSDDRTSSRRVASSQQAALFPGNCSGGLATDDDGEGKSYPQQGYLGSSGACNLPREVAVAEQGAARSRFTAAHESACAAFFAAFPFDARDRRELRHKARDALRRQRLNGPRQQLLDMDSQA